MRVGSMRFIHSQPLPAGGSVSSVFVVNLISSVLVTWTSWGFLPDTSKWCSCSEGGGPARAQTNNRTLLPCPPSRIQVRPRMHCELLRAAPGGLQPHCCCPGWTRRGCPLCLPSPGASPSYPQTGTQKQGTERHACGFFGDGFIMQNRKNHGAAILLQWPPFCVSSRLALGILRRQRPYGCGIYLCISARILVLDI